MERHPAQPNQERESSRERHERNAAELVEGLRARGYVREGEAMTVVPAEPGSAWVVQIDADSLTNATAEQDAELKRLFPADPVEAGLKERGYRVDVAPDFEASTPELFRVTYYAYER